MFDIHAYKVLLGLLEQDGSADLC